MSDKKGDEEILRIIHEALKNGKLRFSTHSLERMEERDIKVFEVEQVVKYGSREERLDELDKKGNYFRYVIRNREVDERDLAISVDIEDAPDAVIITVMQIDPITARKL